MVEHVQVKSVIGYPSYEEAGLQFERKDWIARNMTLALKGRDFNGYSDVKINGVDHRIDRANTQPVVDYFGLCVARAVGRLPQVEAVFIVPSSDCLRLAHDEKAQRIAAAITNARCRVPVYLPFFWNRQLPKAADGGIRNPDILIGHLHFVRPEQINRAILIDDVLTTGGHLRACARACRLQDVEVDESACFARTVWERPENILGNFSTMLER